MSAHALFLDALLGLVVLACWVGVLGMIRMHHPVQALQYLTLATTAGMIALTVAVFVESGFSSASAKMVLMAVIFLAIDSVVTHATARAFRTREIGHWEPNDGDPIEFVPSTHHPQQEKQA